MDPKVRRDSTRKPLRCFSLEQLEARLVMSGQPLSLVAESGAYGLTSIQNQVSLNEDGEIAFIGATSAGTGVYVATKSTAQPKLLSFEPLSLNRDFGTTAVINNSLFGPDQVAARDRLSGNPASFLARRWNSDVPGSFVTVASSSPSSDPQFFDAIQATGLSINDKDEVVFAGLTTQGGTSIKLRVRSERTGNTLDLGDYASLTNLRPQISNNTEVVYLSPTGNSIFRTQPVNLDAVSANATPTRVAGLPEGFLAVSLGKAPGISDDGGAVAFTGATAGGTGVWVSLRVPRGQPEQRQLIQVAGLPDELGAGVQIVDFGRDSRIGVGGTLKNSGDPAENGRASDLYVTFLANDPSTGSEALWRVDLRVRSVVPAELPALGSFEVIETSGPVKLAEVGQTLTLATTANATTTRTINDLEIYDPITDQGSVGFWASFSGGTSGVVRAPGPAPAVLSVVTHGMGNLWKPVAGVELYPFQPIAKDFLDVWTSIGSKLETLPLPTSPIYGDVQSYIADWSSSDGWIEAFGNLFASFALPQGSALSDAAYATYEAQLRRSENNAEAASQQIVADLKIRGMLATPEETQNGDQAIVLIGHSRGAAVNARVAQLLTSQGYKIEEYISLDGYSTDWTYPSNAFADFDINFLIGLPTVRDNIERAVNYRVEEDLAIKYLEPVLSTALSALASSVLGGAVGTVLTPAISALVTSRLPDWSAPPRSSFDYNSLIRGPSDNPSDHLDVGPIYRDSLGASSLGDRYIVHSYVGRNSDRPTQDPVNDASAPVYAADLPPASLTTDDLESSIGLADYGFESTASFVSAGLDSAVTGNDEPLVRLWGALVSNPAYALSTYWTTGGDVSLVDVAGDARAQLVESDGASLSQLIAIRPGHHGLEFDLTILSAAPGDELVVSVGETEIARLDLASASSGVERITLPGGLPSIADITFSLTNDGSPTATIQVDDIALLTRPGDYDVSGAVDEADYDVWLSSYGGTGPFGLVADGNGDGRVDAADYTVWRDSFGTSVPADSTIARPLAVSQASPPTASEEDVLLQPLQLSSLVGRTSSAVSTRESDATYPVSDTSYSVEGRRRHTHFTPMFRSESLRLEASHRLLLHSASPTVVSRRDDDVYSDLSCSVERDADSARDEAFAHQDEWSAITLGITQLA